MDKNGLTVTVIVFQACYEPCGLISLPWLAVPLCLLTTRSASVLVRLLRQVGRVIVCDDGSVDLTLVGDG